MCRIKLIRIVFTLLILFTKLLFSGEIITPDSLGKNWEKFQPPDIFKGNDLYGHINGGAELFLEFGFEDLSIQKYRKGEIEISLELYKMENATAALGIYLMKAGRESPNQKISARNTFNPHQLLLTAGRYYIQINSFSGDKDLIPLMVLLGKKVIVQIDTTAPPEVLSYLPEKDLIRGSQLIFRGPYGLQKIYTMGKGDILLLGGKIFGISGDYGISAENQYTQLVIRYGEVAEAKKAFNNLNKNLDSYIKSIYQDESILIFKDYKQKYGKVETIDNLLKISLHLSIIPDVG